MRRKVLDDFKLANAEFDVDEPWIVLTSVDEFASKAIEGREDLPVRAGRGGRVVKHTGRVEAF